MATEQDYHPAAIDLAAKMIRAGYVQARPTELEDGEDVVLMDGRNGYVAPARHHRYGDLEDGGRRERCVMEIFPDSPFSRMMPFRHAVAESQEGEPHERMGIFRLTAPEHAMHGEALYASREARHRSNVDAE